MRSFVMFVYLPVYGNGGPISQGIGKRADGGYTVVTANNGENGPYVWEMDFTREDVRDTCARERVALPDGFLS